MKISPRVVKASVFGLVLLPLSSLYAQSQSMCRDVLTNGIKNQYSVAANGDLRTAFKAALCSALGSALGNGAANADDALTTPLKGLVTGDNASYDAGQQQMMKSEYCGDGGSQLSDGDFGNLMAGVASETVVADWSKCVEETGRVSSQNNRFGLVSDLYGADEDDLVFKAKWVPQPGSPESVTVANFYVRGATCESLSLAEGAPIGSEWVLQHCVRQGDGPVLFALEASNQMGAAVQRAGQLRVLQSSADPDSVVSVRWSAAPQITSAEDDALFNCKCPKFETSLDRRIHETAPLGTMVRLSNSCSGAMTLLLVKNESEDLRGAPTERVFGRMYALVRLLSGQALEADISGSTSVPLIYVSCPAQ